MNYTLHEALEVHEMATFKTICLTKSKTMKALVSDQKLKDIMQQDIDVTTRQLKEYEKILTKARKQEVIQ